MIAGRQQQGERLAQNLGGGPAKHFFGRPIKENDALVGVYGHDAVHGGIDNARQAGVARVQARTWEGGCRSLILCHRVSLTCSRSVYHREGRAVSRSFWERPWYATFLRCVMVCCREPGLERLDPRSEPVLVTWQLGRSRQA